MKLETRIRERLASSREAAVQIGMDLIEAKKLLDPSSFQPWVSNQFGYSKRTTQLFINAAQMPNNTTLADEANLNMVKESLRCK